MLSQLLHVSSLQKCTRSSVVPQPPTGTVIGVEGVECDDHFVATFKIHTHKLVVTFLVAVWSPTVVDLIIHMPLVYLILTLHPHSPSSPSLCVWFMWTFLYRWTKQSDTVN